MGSCFSAASVSNDGDSSKKPKATSDASTSDSNASVIAAPVAKKLNPKDFMFLGKKNELLVKWPGEISGQQFVIEECENCQIFLLDHCAQVTVDACSSCNVFIGPCEGSIFIRECKNSTFMAACQQFRTRDCEDLQLFLHCNTQPSLETSRNIQIACFQFFYPELLEQFSKAGLSVFNNEWDRVYDFNGSKLENWKYMAPESAAAALSRISIREEILAQYSSTAPSGNQDATFSYSTMSAKSTVPVTMGADAAKNISQRGLVILAIKDDSVALDLVSSLFEKNPDIQLLRTKRRKSTKSDISQFFEEKADSSIRSAIQNSESIQLGYVYGIEVVGDSSIVSPLTMQESCSEKQSLKEFKDLVLFVSDMNKINKFFESTDH